MKFKNLLAAMVTPALLALVLAACGGGSSGSGSYGGGSNRTSGQTTSPPRVTSGESEAPDVTAADEEEASRSYGDVPSGLQSEAGAPQTVKGANASPEAGFQTGVNDYWADDQCHYYFDGNQWHGDFCWSEAAPGLINYYLYPGPGRQPTTLVYQETVDPDMHIIRNLTSPLFHYVQWMSWPKGEQPTVSNTTYLLQGRSDWLTVAQTQAVLSQQAAGNVPQVSPHRLPAYVWNGEMFNNAASPWTKPNCVGLDYRDDPRCP